MRTSAAALACFVLVASPVLGQQAPPDYGFDFVTIGDVGNRGYDRDDLRDNITGLGSIDYEYRIARTEVTTAQYVEFRNGLIDAGLGAQLNVLPQFFGGGFDGERWVVLPGLDDLPVAGVGWRDAALFVNWLHNDKKPVPESFQSGAYDISTFGSLGGGQFSDQSTRSPGARYWIPSHDEWLKAAHWDPNKEGPGEGGWWLYSDGSDTQPEPGLPGEGETSAGLDVGDFTAFSVPLKSYPETQSPWGLLDLSGGAPEWTEGWTMPNDVPVQEARIWQGNGAGTGTWNPDIPFFFSNDLAWEFGANRPDLSFRPISFRVASVIPSPGTGAILAAGLALAGTRRRSGPA
ncbi:MAG: SUMF1/EgtB/PvdO family nonheme iron enzyme [Myxococcota bacterium]